jgi:putative endonuclease
MEESSKPSLPQSSFFVYIVECSDSTLYTGYSNNVDKRIATHNAGKGAKYTKARLPVIFRWKSEPLSKSDALKLEHTIKKLPRTQKLELINAFILKAQDSEIG